MDFKKNKNTPIHLLDLKEFKRPTECYFGCKGNRFCDICVPKGIEWSQYLYWNTDSNSWSLGGGTSDAQRIHLGLNAGRTNQGTNAIAIGNLAGSSNQGSNSIAIGAYANSTFPNTIVLNATGSNNPLVSPIVDVSNSFYVAPIREASNSFKILYYHTHDKEITYGDVSGSPPVLPPGLCGAALLSKGGSSITWGYSIGCGAGCNNQKTEAIAYGCNAGNTNQGTYSIAIGYEAGKTDQSANAIAIGYQAGLNIQKSNAIAIGASAGSSNQGSNSIAIGNNAGSTNQVANSIVLNASGVVRNPTTPSLYVDPIRELSGANILYYDNSTKEITYSVPRNPFLIPSYYPLGVFYSTQTQTTTAINTTLLLTYNNTDISNGVYVGSPNSRIYVSQTGIYRIFATLQIDSAQNDTRINYWLKQNGNNVPNTSSFVIVKNSREEIIAPIEWVISLNGGEYIEVGFISLLRAGGEVITIPGGGTPPNDYPSSPSIIISVQRVN